MSGLAGAEDGADVEPVGLSPGTILLWAVWTGLVSGFLELGAFLLKCNVVDPRNYNASRHFVWMYPVAGLAVICLPGVGLALLACVRRAGVSARAAASIFAFFPLLGLLFRAPIFTVACFLLAAGAARIIGKRIGADGARADRMVRRSLGPLVGVGLVLVVASFGRKMVAERCAESRLAAADGEKKNVLLLVLDTVRAESLSLYGYERDTSPNLCRMARRGVRFDRAFSTAPWTAPSHGSMFTGRWPHQLSVSWDRPLDRTHRTLAEHLAAHGYLTAGFVANTSYCSYETGLDRGFLHYEDYDVSLRSVLLCSSLAQRTLTFLQKRPALARLVDDPRRPGAGRKDAARIHGDFLDWLDNHPGRPFFAFLNDYDAHHPYLAPEGADDGSARSPKSDANYALLKTWWDRDKRHLTPAELRLVREAYDRCLVSLDRQVGRLFDALERRGLLENTVVIVTADHGEHLGEQQLFGHGCSLYRSELHVPLLIMGPGVPADRIVRAPVSLRDLAATILDLTGSKDSPFPGSTLAHCWSGDADAERPRPILSELDAPPEADPNGGRSPVCRGPMTSVVAGGWHYIRNGDGAEELYDVETDPAERCNLAGRTHVVDALRQLPELARAARVDRLTK